MYRDEIRQDVVSVCVVWVCATRVWIKYYNRRRKHRSNIIEKHRQYFEGTIYHYAVHHWQTINTIEKAVNPV